MASGGPRIRRALLSVLRLAPLCAGLLLGACGGDGDPLSAEALAALQAAHAGDAQAQFNVGVSYDLGQGFPQNWVKAEEYYQMAAKQGHPRAQFNLGLLYDEGRGQPGGDPNKREAQRWYLEAAQQGHPRAQNKLGGLHVELQNWSEAERWWLEAARRGHAKAQRNLGALYARGEGVPQNHTLAYAWSEVASRQGVVEAKRYRESAEAKLDMASLARAQKLADEYYERYVEPFQ